MTKPDSFSLAILCCESITQNMVVNGFETAHSAFEHAAGMLVDRGKAHRTQNGGFTIAIEGDEDVYGTPEELVSAYGDGLHSTQYFHVMPSMSVRSAVAS